MDILPAGSRLAVVRSQLTIDSSSEGSCTPPCTDKEPFPEYNESDCDTLASESAAVECDDEAWNYALGKAIQTEIRLHQVDPNIIPLVPSDPAERSQVVLEELKDILANPQMRHQTRHQFITLVNITLQVNQVIFHQSSEFLAPKETSDAKLLTETILTHLAWLDALLKEQCQTVDYIACLLSQIEHDDVPVYEKLREMARVVAKNLKKPRPLERQLLELYLGLFEEWVHTPFLHLRNRQVLGEDTACLARTELSRHVNAIWDVICRCIENYGAYTWATLKIREEFFAPTMDHLVDAKDIWEQCWNHEVATTELSSCPTPTH